ncbi:MAG: triphosphoribosyl-dephospho-CoA synthase [Neisseriaceae bacterium]|nr:triphosphoribosyl-dephospho-CoA synthase [Neisseriaceae bacterium]MBP6861532.1 triphosphoribosyl-dephospho-CoA synthase [Neisseriaceae bacterium]
MTSFLSTGVAPQILAHELAAKAVWALQQEALLTPKPGLVDASGSGAHTDMDVALLLKGASSLYPAFYDMALAAQAQALSQRLRERLALIGRRAEASMLAETGGVNTHKGAIWALGLLVAVCASGIERAPHRLLLQCGRLAAFADEGHRPLPTRGQALSARYGVVGALGQAQRGFPVVRDYGLIELGRSQGLGVPHTALWQNALMALMAQLDDTCLLGRGGFEGLRRVQHLAAMVLRHGGVQTLCGGLAYQHLCAYCQRQQLSPGGSADLLALMMFLQHD